MPRDIPKLPPYIAPRHILELSSADLEWTVMFARRMNETWSSERPESTVWGRGSGGSFDLLFFQFLRISSVSTRSEDEIDDGRYIALVSCAYGFTLTLRIWDSQRSKDEELSYFQPVAIWSLSHYYLGAHGVCSSDLYGLDDEDAVELLGDNPRGACLFAIMNKYTKE